VSQLRTLAMAFAAALLAVSAKGQTDERPLRQMALTTWTTDQGLPQNFIRSIAQTRDGFLWVGTMDGLARFDGVRFRSFGRQGPPELDQNIAGLAPDGQYGLWIAAATQLLHYHDGRFDSIPFAGAAHYPVDIFVSGRDGGAWVYSGGKLAHAAHGRLDPWPSPPGSRLLRDLAEGKDHTLWAADGERVIAMRKDAPVAVYPLAGARMVYADSFGSLFAGDGHRLFRFDGKGFRKIDSPGLGNFVSILVDHRQRLWMASGGLHGISRNTDGRREVLTAADGLAANDVRTLFEDRDGDVWIGTISGLQRLHAGVFASYSPQDGQQNGASGSDQIDAVFAQKNGALWAGSLEGGVAELASGRWRRTGVKQGLTAGQVRGFAEDRDAPDIAVSDYGIFHLQGGRFRKISGVAKGYVGTPVRARDGSLWFSVDHRGLFRLQHGVPEHIGTSQGVPDGPIWSITEDTDGTLWVGAGNDLLRWRGERFEDVRTLPSPALNFCRMGTTGMAIGMLNGLLLQPPEQSAGGERVLRRQDGLPGDTVLDTIADDDENLWIATTRSIARLPRADWMAFAEHRLDHVSAQVFTRDDGLKSNAVLPLNEVTVARGADGRIWFATPRGLAVIDPELAPQAQAVPLIDSIVVDDSEEPAASLSIGPGQHRVTFVYTTPPAPAVEQTRFRYRLHGWDKSWIDAGTAREVSYTALPPGKYKFEVLAVNRAGAASPAPATALLELRPYFWQTRSFLVLTVLAAVLLIVEVTRRRTRASAEKLSLRFQERVAERERIAYQIHDTVIQDMIGAALQVELLGFQIADQPEKAESLLGSLAARLRETIARSRNMVSSLHSTAVTQYSLVEVLRHAEAEFRLGDLPAFELISEGELRHIHPLIRDEVYRICREAVANAFRHANAQRVRVIVRFLPQSLEIEIADDGQGMDEEHRLHGRPGHFGLPGMKAHAERIGATIEIVSAPGEGTQVLLRVRTRQPRRFPWFQHKAARGVLIEQNETEAHEASN
jgi:signal transduction histidine kinase/ligand-binding sensor domain-containing protein